MVLQFLFQILVGFKSKETFSLTGYFISCLQSLQAKTLVSSIRFSKLKMIISYFLWGFLQLFQLIKAYNLFFQQLLGWSSLLDSYMLNRLKEVLVSSNHLSLTIIFCRLKFSNLRQLYRALVFYLDLRVSSNVILEFILCQLKPMNYFRHLKTFSNCLLLCLHFIHAQHLLNLVQNLSQLLTFSPEYLNDIQTVDFHCLIELMKVHKSIAPLVFTFSYFHTPLQFQQKQNP